jgi:pyruvyl transferase EpsO
MNARERQAADRKFLADLVGGWLQGERACALLGYPNHWNAGDSVIWRSARLLLDHLKVEVRYACDPLTYHPATLRRRLPEGPLLLTGGGNFGDVYPNESGLRARVLADFPNRRILQLPQSLWFTRPESLGEWAGRLTIPMDFTLLVRDRTSLDLAQTHFPVLSLPCPDLSAWLDTPPADRSPSCDVFVLWREDSESPGPPPTRAAGLSLEVQDWAHPLARPGDPPPLQWLARWNRIRDRLSARHPALARRWDAAFPGGADAVARERIRNALRQLARGRVVITNRLHAALLCRMRGWPHVVCDNAIGKLGAYADAWPCEEDTIRRAGSSDEALEQARNLLDAGRRAPVTP